MGLENEVVSLRDFNDSVKYALTNKGYLGVSCQCYVNTSGEYRETHWMIEYKPINKDREYKHFNAQTCEDVGTAISEIVQWCESLELAEDEHRKDLIRQMENLTTDMEASGLSGAKAIVDAIMEPLRTNLLGKK